MSHYAIFGNPLSHSLSPQLHRAFAQQLGIIMNYEKILTPLDQFKKTVDDFRAQGGLGASITTPFKTQAFEYADQLTDRAILAGAVNTFIFKDGICIGDNTDGVGLVRDLKNHAVYLYDKTILILGAGGAARGIIGEIIQEKPHKICIYNRTPENTENIIRFFEPCFQIKILSCEKQFDLIINATNMNFQKDFSLDLNLVNTFCYDLNYGERHNPFYNYALSHGAQKIIDGMGMLIEQGAEAFFQWFDKQLCRKLKLIKI